MNESFPNMDYVAAPFEVSFMLAVHVPPAVRAWSRKRRLKWRRRVVNYAMNYHKRRLKEIRDGMVKTMYRAELKTAYLPDDMRPPLLPILFKRSDYHGERDRF